MKFVRNEWDIEPDLDETCTPEEAWHMGFWECHRQMFNEMARFQAEMKRRRWPNMASGARMLMKHLLEGKVSAK